MSAKDTGIVMDDEQQYASELDAGIYAETQNVVADAEKTEPDVNSPLDSQTPAPAITLSETQLAMSPSDGQSSLVEGDKIFTQAQHDAIIRERDKSFQARIDLYKGQADRNKAEADDYKKRHAKFCDFARHKDSLFEKAYALLDGSDARLFQLISKYVQTQLDNETKVELEERLRKAEGELKRVMLDYDRLVRRNGDLERDNRQMSTSETRLQAAVAQKDTELGNLRDEIGKWQGVGDRMISAMVPKCLVDKKWFLELLSELQDGIFADQPSDHAMLVFASLAELAVMERSSEGPCFEWKKQLTDIGLVVANYMHQKRTEEGDVLALLQNFAQAFQEIPIFRRLRLGIRIPALGGDFNTDEVRHKNNGRVVTKVLNWCIVEDGHVYCKAIVE